jgi:hypothetical protein
MRQVPLLRSLAAGVLMLAALASATPVSGIDLGELRQRAQGVADEVTALERRLAMLAGHQRQIEQRMARLHRLIGSSREEIEATHNGYRAAQARLVDQAVEMYKSGPTAGLEPLLGADTLAESWRASVTMKEVAETSELVFARAARLRQVLTSRVGRYHRQLDDLDSAQSRIEALKEEAEATLSRRRAVLQELNEDIQALLRMMRASLSGGIGPHSPLLGPASRAEVESISLVPSGIAFEGIASWYGAEFAGQSTASGDIFDPALYTAASKDLALGTLLYVSRGDAGVVVLINDRGPYGDGRIIDLSRASARAVGIDGLGWIRAEVLFVPTPR